MFMLFLFFFYHIHLASLMISTVRNYLPLFIHLVDGHTRSFPLFWLVQLGIGTVYGYYVKYVKNFIISLKYPFSFLCVCVFVEQENMVKGGFDFISKTKWLYNNRKHSDTDRMGIARKYCT